MTSLTCWARKYVEPILRPVALMISRTGIKADHLTVLAFISGLAAVYFLLTDWTWFTIFAITHIVLDILDGSLARATGSSTRKGKQLDWWSDRTIAFLMIGKCIYYFGQTPLTWITWQTIVGVLALAFGFLSALWYSTSRQDLPALNARSLILILGMLKLSHLIIPIAFAVYISSLIWQSWYTLNNI